MVRSRLYFGDKPVIGLYWHGEEVTLLGLRDKVVWEKSAEPYLRIAPTIVWVVPDFESIVKVESNVDWKSE